MHSALLTLHLVFCFYSLLGRERHSCIQPFHHHTPVTSFMYCSSLAASQSFRHASSQVASLLATLRSKTSPAARVTDGLPAPILERFAHDKTLIQAIQEANVFVDDMIREHGLLSFCLVRSPCVTPLVGKAAVVKDELKAMADVQSGYGIRASPPRSTTHVSSKLL
jgi:hypothetical protein